MISTWEIDKRRATLWSKQTKIFNIYILILLIIMVITNIVSLDPLYSIFSGLFVILLFGAMFHIVGSFISRADQNLQYKKQITVHLLFILVVSLVGNLIIPHWNWDSTWRMSGGIGPTMMALLSMFCFVWFMDLRIDRLFIKYSVVGVLLSVVILFWTMSRGRIISFLILIFYIAICYLIVMLNPKLKYTFNRKKSLFYSFSTCFFILSLLVVVYYLADNDQIISRLLTSIGERERAWEILIEGFKSNIWLGSYGWWNANEVIKEYSFYDFSIANSSHNHYLRVLSEVGLLGLLAICILPAALIILSLKKALFKSNLEKTQRKKLILYSGALFSFFVSQLVEDQYLNGIGNFQTGLFAWLTALTYYVLKKNDVDSNEKQT
ncbi:O-antigen ligase family protein [Paenibacillus sp. IB182496]|uniref:O-antigen ligase family protein n=1 Tax=Paenibacillus sabuli TaxID=2772509 RepID=A0A927BVF0_9BACL|nr:O-antigen ligase family protein [Paenibacillus sabuli]MBD2847557.1 O-antigen ligase family protein [Paenibacillus sabuli]